MPNNPGGSGRPKWLNKYRAFSAFMLTVLVGMGAIGLNMLSDVSDRSFAPITPVQTSKVATAAALLETVGFNDPVYLGVTPGTEGEYPTFRATAIGGKSIKLWIRTARSGGLEIQPVGLYESIASADALASLAAKAVSNWKYIPPSIKPRTDGNWGEYEARQYDYNLLAKYVSKDSGELPSQTRDWPRE